MNYVGEIILIEAEIVLIEAEIVLITYMFLKIYIKFFITECAYENRDVCLVSVYVLWLSGI